MSSNPNAENSASKSAISNQGSGPSASPEQAINRDPVEQGNTPTEKNLNKPLSRREKVKLIQAAIQKSVDIDLSTWGSIDLSQLINYEQEDSTSIDGGVRFFRELLLFVARPAVSASFENHVYEGLDNIRMFIRFFDGLKDNDHYDEWAEYAFIESGDSTEEDIEAYAKRYLSGDDLTRVLAHEAEKPNTPPPILSTPWYLRSEPEENPLTLTDEELLVALDRHHPGVQWPTDKKAIIANEKMRDHLTFEEKYRLRILNETPEQKQKRLVDAAVYSELNGPSIPEQIRSIGDKVEAAVKAPKVLEPDTEIQFRLDKVKMQPLTKGAEEAKLSKPTSRKATTSPASKPANNPSAKKSLTTKKA